MLISRYSITTLQGDGDDLSQIQRGAGCFLASGQTDKHGRAAHEKAACTLVNTASGDHAGGFPPAAAAKSAI